MNFHVGIAHAAEAQGQPPIALVERAGQFTRDGHAADKIIHARGGVGPLRRRRGRQHALPQGGHHGSANGRHGGGHARRKIGRHHPRQLAGHRRLPLRNGRGRHVRRPSRDIVWLARNIRRLLRRPGRQRQQAHMFGKQFAIHFRTGHHHPEKREREHHGTSNQHAVLCDRDPDPAQPAAPQHRPIPLHNAPTVLTTPTARWSVPAQWQTAPRPWPRPGPSADSERRC